MYDVMYDHPMIMQNAGWKFILRIRMDISIFCISPNTCKD